MFILRCDGRIRDMIATDMYGYERHDHLFPQAFPFFSAYSEPLL